MHQSALDDLAAAIATTATMLAKLQAEHAAGKAAQRLAIVQAFDDGGSRKQIAAAFGVSYHHITNVLGDADPPRTLAQRLGLGLPPEKRPHYHRLLAAKVPSRIARQIAETVTV